MAASAAPIARLTVALLLNSHSRNSGAARASTGSDLDIRLATVAAASLLMAPPLLRSVPYAYRGRNLAYGTTKAAYP